MSKHFGDGHAVVELAPVTESRLLAPAILSALGVEPADRRPAPRSS